MRKLTGFILCCIMIVYSSVAALANTSYNQSEKEEIILQEYLVDDSDIVFSMELFNKTYSREDVADMLKVEKAKENPASWALVKAECGNSQYWTNEGSLEQQFRCHALGETFYPGDVGDWDLEPIRPNVGLIEYAINKCNPV